MRSVADELRRDPVRRQGAAGTAEGRLLEALQLGDSGVELRAASTGESVAVARRALERQAARGRRPSRCAER